MHIQSTTTRTSRSLSVAALFLALATPLLSIAAPPVVALHRTEIVGEQPENSEVLHALVAAELIRRGASLAPSEGVQAFLAKKDGSCLPLPDAQRTTCLVELAKAVGAQRTLILTVAPYVPKKIILSAMVVDQKGATVQSIPAAEFARKQNIPVERALEVALAEFVPQLKIFEDLSLQLEPLAENPKVTDPETEPASANGPTSPAIIEPAPTQRPSRVLAWSTLAAGAVVAGAGTFGVVHGQSRIAEFEAAYADERQPPLNEQERLGELLRSGQQSRMLGGIGLGIGAAAVGAGLYLLFSGNDDTPASSTQVLISPTSVGVSFAFH